MWRRFAAVALMLSAAMTHAADSARFLALGDSYTIGEGVAADERWPVQLVAALRHKGLVIDAPEIVARTGWTTDELAAAMKARPFDPPYALVTLLIGVNNQYRGRDLGKYREEFRALLARAIELAGGNAQRVVVVSIPDWGATIFGHGSGRDVATIAREIDTYNQAGAEISASLHVRYADVTPASRIGGDAKAMLVEDGLHPSAAMYHRWIDAILPQAISALSSH